MILVYVGLVPSSSLGLNFAVMVKFTHLEQPSLMQNFHTTASNHCGLIVRHSGVQLIYMMVQMVYIYVIYYPVMMRLMSIIKLFV